MDHYLQHPNLATLIKYLLARYLQNLFWKSYTSLRESCHLSLSSSLVLNCNMVHRPDISMQAPIAGSFYDITGNALCNTCYQHAEAYAHQIAASALYRSASYVSTSKLNHDGHAMTIRLRPGVTLTSTTGVGTNSHCMPGTNCLIVYVPVLVFRLY